MRKTATFASIDTFKRTQKAVATLYGQARQEQAAFYPEYDDSACFSRIRDAYKDYKMTLVF